MNKPVAANENDRVDPERLKESLNRLFDIYRGISQTADELTKTRCPYKDARARCTANFGCRNQYFTKDPSALPICAGSDKLDYRSAWEEGATEP